MMRSHGVNEGTMELQRKLDAYLHSPGLSVGNKLFFLHFVFLCKLLVYPVTVFFFLVCQRCTLLTYVYRAENGICYVV